MPKLRATVHVNGVTYYAGDEPNADVAALITNPAAWEVAPKQAKAAEKVANPNFEQGDEWTPPPRERSSSRRPKN